MASLALVWCCFLSDALSLRMCATTIQIGYHSNHMVLLMRSSFVVVLCLICLPLVAVSVEREPASQHESLLAVSIRSLLTVLLALTSSCPSSSSPAALVDHRVFLRASRRTAALAASTAWALCLLAAPPALRTAPPADPIKHSRSN